MQRLRRLNRPVAIGGFVAICLALAVASFLLGQATRSPSDVSVPIVTSVGPTTTEAVMRRVGTVASVDGEASTGKTLRIVPNLPPGAERLVIESVRIKRGQPVRDGMVLGVVSGRPLIAMMMPVPLARSVSLGDSNPDVVKVQKQLQHLGYFNRRISGVYGQDLASAVYRFYHDRGFDPPSSTDSGNNSVNLTTASDGAVNSSSQQSQLGGTVSISEFVPMPAGTPTVASVAKRGTLLGGDNDAFAFVQIGRSAVSARVDVNSSAQFRPGTKVDVQVPGVAGKMYRGQVASVSAFKEADDSHDLPGYDVRVDLDDGQPEGLTDNQSVSVRPVGSTVRESLAVPLITIRQDSQGTYVLSRETSSGRAFARVEVQVVTDADGWASLDNNTSLKPGDLVQISP